MYKKAQPARFDMSKKVLIVESDRLTRNVLSKIIANYLGCDVNIARSVREAESFIRSINFDLFVIGISRDSVADINLIKKVRAINGTIPVIVVLGDCNEADMDEIKNLGIDKIAYKPLKLTPFLEIVAGTFIESERVFNYA